MISKPTLFILGAGASIPYGFPSGWDLRNDICTASGISRITSLSIVSDYLRITQTDVHDFIKCFKHSSIASIDAFLSKRPEFSDIGKAIIAALLIPKEQINKFNKQANEDDWYFWLWNALVSNISSIDELSQNNVKIFTFNYDRSLEVFLHNSIVHTFNVSEEEALQSLKYFGIQHLYGSLGEYGLKDDSSTRARRYTPELNHTSLSIAANSIKVIPEARAEDTVFANAREALSWSKHVCFLGFGFDALNVQRLGFQETIYGLTVHEMPSKIVTSAYGKTLGEIQLAKDLLLGDSQIEDDYGTKIPAWDFTQMTNLKTLREFAWLLQ